MDAHCDKGSWQFTPPIIDFEASQLADCAATSFMLITWVPEQEIWSLRNHKVHNRGSVDILMASKHIQA